MAEVDNVLLIVVDALRTDRVGAYGNSDLTPNIDELSTGAEVFESAYACINATDPSMTTILSGQYPTSHGLLNHQKHITDTEREYMSAVSLLPEMLEESQKTIGVDILERWHKRGFDKYYKGNKNGSKLRNIGEDILNKLPKTIDNRFREIYQLLSDDSSTPYISASEATNILLQELNNTDDSWFSLIHYWDTHLPYVPLSEIPKEIQDRSYSNGDVPLATATEDIKGSSWRENLLSLSGDAETIGDMKRKYDAGVKRVDDNIGRIVKYLRENEQYENTMIILTADHGESLGENGVFFDHHTLYDPCVHIPLIIDGPQFDGREEMYVQHFDIVPTILDVLEVSNDSERFDGKSLFTQTKDRDFDRSAVFHEEAHTARRRAIRTSDYKYIKRIDQDDPCRYCNIHHSRGDELYDLEDDKQLTIDHVQEVVQTLEGQLERWINSRPIPGKSNINFDSSGEIESRLEDMGYL